MLTRLQGDPTARHTGPDRHHQQRYIALTSSLRRTCMTLSPTRSDSALKSDREGVAAAWLSPPHTLLRRGGPWTLRYRALGGVPPSRHQGHCFALSLSRHRGVMRREKRLKTQHAHTRPFATTVCLPAKKSAVGCRRRLCVRGGQDQGSNRKTPIKQAA